MMKKRIFLPTNQSITQTLPFLQPQIKPLSYLIPSTIYNSTLTKQLQQFAQQTFVIQDPLSPVKPNIYHPQQFSNKPSPKFIQILNENVRQLLLSNHTNYVQCLGQEYKDYNLHTKNMNFGKTMLEISCMEKLCQILGYEWMTKLIYNYAIVLKYEGDYFQVTGMQIPDMIKKPFEKKKKLNNSNTSKNNLTYSTELINRFQMLYCTHINRNSGLFRKNIFFDKGVKKSDFYHEIKMLVDQQIKSMFPQKLLKQQQKQSLQNLIHTFFTSTRDIFTTKRQNNRNMCEFDMMLAQYCPLTQNYRSIKSDVLAYINSNVGSSQQLFQRMYASESSYIEVHRLLKELVVKIYPIELLGAENKSVMVSMLKQFISMKRYENYRIEDFLNKMDIFKVSWIKVNYNKKYKKQIIQRSRRIMAPIISMLFNKLLVPVLKLNFYITEKHKQANKLFYFRKPLWILVSKLALKKFSEINLQSINQSQYFQIKKMGTDYPEGKLRLMPKKGTFRPIITFNRKRKVQGDFYKATLNQILSDTQLVLRNLKNILGTEIGYCIFDNRQISKKYDAFIEKWRSKGKPKLVYFTLDIKKCYDSIDTNTLVQIIQKTPYIQQVYLMIKYLRLYRNKRPIIEKRSINHYFNTKQRVYAASLKNDPMKIYEDGSIPAINIFLAKQKLITRQQIIKKLKQLCDGSIIRYKKQIWLQKLGIPQGLNVSGVLCSLYFAYLEEQYVRVDEGILMRLTDDYLYIGPEEEGVNVLTSLLECARNNKFVFNAQKITKNFHHPYVENITNQHFIHWIGKKININTLQIFPAFDQKSDKLAYAMNVNLSNNRKQIKGFLKNKLKSLLTNHFAAYFKPHVYSIETQLQNIRLYCKISLSKFFPFLISLHSLKIEQDEQKLILKILQLTIHEFLIYACSFHRQQQRYYHYHKYLHVVLGEFVAFMKSKRSYQFMQYVERIFRGRWKRLGKEVSKYQQEMWGKRMGIQGRVEMQMSN